MERRNQLQSSELPKQQASEGNILLDNPGSAVVFLVSYVHVNKQSLDLANLGASM